MASSGLHGPYDLTIENIDDVVRGKGPGAYALGNSSAQGATFVIRCVGRSDDDLNARLKKWVGRKYPQFKYRLMDSSKAAFEKECQLFHDFGETATLDNEVHPARPKGSDWKCPRCNIFR